MRGVNRSTISQSAPPFLAEPVGAATLLPGGGRLERYVFPGMDVVPAGTAVGRSKSLRAYGPFGPARADSYQVYLTAYDVRFGQDGDEAVLVKPGTTVYEDRLPGFDQLAPEVQEAIRETYVCIMSVDSAG